MADKGKPYYLDSDGVKAIRATNKARKAELSPLTQVKRRRYDEFSIAPMVVTQARTASQVDTPFGFAENTFVDCDFVGYGANGAPATTCFTAKPYTNQGQTILPNIETVSNVGTYGSLSNADMTNVSDVLVCSRGINGVIFTGQLIFVAFVGQNLTSDVNLSVVGDVLGGSTGTSFFGTVADIVATDSKQVYIDVNYRQFYTTKAKLRPKTCRVLAYNDTGIQLVSGQSVTIEHFAAHGSGVPVSLSNGKSIGCWVVTRYRCA